MVLSVLGKVHIWLGLWDLHTECAEDDEGEGVADDPFTNGTDNHEDAAKEEVRC